ncbi:hypothetical protein [Spirosoma utsteinense]|uniref:Flap endonuclease-1-like 5' DNA nuclease n=1 Tax=Spirosoma utsteinense TaxID=2585773 RepID=A0ABR6W788_9BACT|nr:hypothetical protein [Spirosoma utsteinense]MBC3785826.1 putative flap endonuclease-1-like 5' DNA nuclease [Spirosoma utsteinense]MBC3791998.1 putative flap endonuclease-1-like 5' DNA nuclease [Spirosoma utsteinense]
MFGLDPLSRPVALAEILLLLAFAAFVGWLLGRLVLSGRINALRSSIADKEAELNECRKSVKTAVPARDTLLTPAHEVAVSKPVNDPPVTFVSADPLLPAYSHDDTPELTDEEPISISQRVVFEDVPVQSATEPDALALDLHGRIEEPIAAPVAASTLVFDSPGANNTEAAVLNRIASRAGEVNFDRIGRATAAEADDLKDIVGIGPFLERKLHSLGIYTFRQIANFTKEDVDTVNGIIEFFPGRIERDNWVEQSQGFHERKYGAKS